LSFFRAMDDECTVCCGSTSHREWVRVTVDETRVYCVHACCYEKCSRNMPVRRLRLAQLNIFEGSYVTDVQRESGPVCCAADCIGSGDGIFWKAECTRAGCPHSYIHKSCAEAKTTELVSKLSKQRNNSQSEDVLRKTIFAAKYDIARPFCPCICGSGFYRVLCDTSADVQRRTSGKVRSVAQQPPTDTQEKSISGRRNRRSVSPMRTRKALFSSPATRAPSTPEAELDTKDADARDASAWKARFASYDPPLAGLPPLDRRTCPITRLPIRETLRDGDGRAYERAAFFAWVEHFGTHPISGLSVR
jgi:hypothetical protein